MKHPDLLLDTHALIWYDSKPAVLPVRVRKLITSSRCDVYWSAISMYELWQKAARGDHDITAEFVESILNHLPSYGFKMLPVHAHHARIGACLEWSNKDPFDRIIAAQAIVDGLHVVTADTAFSALEQIQVVWE